MCLVFLRFMLCIRDASKARYLSLQSAVSIHIPYSVYSRLERGSFCICARTGRHDKGDYEFRANYTRSRANIKSIGKYKTTGDNIFCLAFILLQLSTCATIDILFVVFMNTLRVTLVARISIINICRSSRTTRKGITFRYYSTASVNRFRAHRLQMFCQKSII